jgi:protein-tyrosine phosphatase
MAEKSSEIHEKFLELEWQQQFRIAQGRYDPTSKWVVEVTTQAKLRNRYFNVQPWEKSRVHLKVGEGKCDYINASPISLRDPASGQDLTYIAAQV